MTVKNIAKNFAFFALGLSLHSLSAGFNDNSFDTAKRTAKKDTAEIIDSIQKISNDGLNAIRHYVAKL